MTYAEVYRVALEWGPERITAPYNTLQYWRQWRAFYYANRCYWRQHKHKLPNSAEHNMLMASSEIARATAEIRRLSKCCASCDDSIADGHRMPNDQGFLCWRCYRERSRDRSGL